MRDADPTSNRGETSSLFPLFPPVKVWILFLLFALSPGLRAQELEIDFDELFRQGDQWARENLDENFLQALGEVDRKQVLDYLKELEKRLRASDVLDLAELREGAKAILPLLERHPETEPYVPWLKSRLEYLEAADDLSRSMPKPPSTEKPALRRAPTPAQEQKIWEKRLSVVPLPAPVEAGLPGRLKPIFAQRQTPRELVWLAEIESSLNPKARSPAGAAGLYQLMPVTAKEQGLRLWPRDERLDPEKNAAAAASHLRRLHERFGDWQLALAAYNAGEGRVQQLLEKHKTRSYAKIAPYLPAETQMYVPRFEATLKKREGLTLAQLERKRG